jgi:ABC-type transporter Mla subunit MlaD
MAEFNDETVRELNDSIRELTEVMQSAMGITGSSMSSQKDFSKSLGNASSSASVLSTRNKEVATSATNVSTANKLAAEAAYTVGKSLSTLGAATKESKDALVTLGKTMLDTREGMTKYNAALNQAASAAATGLSSFGPLGKAIGLLLKPLTMLVEQVFAFQDNLFLAKDELAKFGAVGQLTTTEIQKMGEASGYSTFEIEKYAKTVTKAGIGLVGLGGSVSQGVVEFTKLTAITKEEQYRLLSLGVTMDDFVENTADFVKLQTISGRAITEKMKTDGSLQRAAKEYTDNLLVLAALSGESVEEQKRKQEQLAKDEVVQLANLATEAKIAELRKGNAADNAEADKLARKLKLEQEAVALVGSKLDMDAAKSLAHYLATGIITPETMKIMRGTGMSLEEFRISLSQGKDVNAKFVDGIVESDRRNISSNTLALQTSEEYRKQMGYSSTRLANLNSLQDKSVEQTKKEIEAKIKAGLGNDEAEQNRKTALENEKKFRASIDGLSKSFQPFIPTFNEFVKKMTGFVEKLSKVDWQKKFDELIKGFDDIIDYFKNFASNIGIGPETDSPEDIAKYEAQNKENKKVMSVGERASTFVAEGLEGAVGLVSGSAARRLAAGRIDRDSKEAANRRSATTPSDITSRGHALQSGSSEKIKLSNINTKSGKNTQVNSEYAKSFQGFIDELESSGYKINSLGGYVDRDVRGQPGQKSIHSYGAAIDINPDANPMGSSLVTDMPSNISEMAGRYGLGWGGNWKTKKDAMHFTGASSEGGSLLQARLGGSFAGPNSGYPVMLHGAETVVPTPNPSTSLIKIEGEAAANKITSALSGMNSDALNSIMQDLYSMMEERLSAMIDKLSTSNDIQDKLLKAQM